jgi:hypothetical protein
MTGCEYRRQRRSVKKPTTSSRERLTAVERYINKVKAGCGSRSFKEWLTSKPMDAFVIKRD